MINSSYSTMALEVEVMSIYFYNGYYNELQLILEGVVLVIHRVNSELNDSVENLACEGSVLKERKKYSIEYLVSFFLLLVSGGFG